jgi:hypothetical protein
VPPLTSIVISVPSSTAFITIVPDSISLGFSPEMVPAVVVIKKGLPLLPPSNH